MAVVALFAIALAVKGSDREPHCMARRTGVTWEQIVAMVTGWPGVSIGTFYGTPGLKVGTTEKNAKGFARLWSEREHRRDDVHDSEVLVLFADIDEKPILIESSGGVLFQTPHYANHNAMLVRMADANHDDLVGWLEDSYRQKAPDRLLDEFDSAS